MKVFNEIPTKLLYEFAGQIIAMIAIAAALQVFKREMITCYLLMSAISINPQSLE